VIANQHEVLSEIALEVSGIMTNQKSQRVQEQINKLRQVASQLGVNPEIDDPFILLAFLSLPVIPKLKLTYRGLFDVEKFKLITLESDEIQHE
jgi:adenine deaminase